MEFNFTENRNEEIHANIDSLFLRTDETAEQRSQNANDLIESYMAAVPGGFAAGFRTGSHTRRAEIESRGERMPAIANDVMPPSAALERLGSYIMREDYEDMNPDKVADAEYPVLSETQIKLRMRREFPNEDIYFSVSDTIGRRFSKKISDHGAPTGDRVHILEAAAPNIHRIIQ